ncbi:MAG: zf-HC2 domain-containing protein [Phycisphaerales bacterium]|nr:zf-HC2 domain-containing protein [Phycisphaerae bacterium]NNF42096.1 zf-HC2 domain-containing protein [Phycisphaerales bacterium]NNM26760.1 zf-HC2 domain-containing protein [Phycisphaerales bacterium]
MSNLLPHSDDLDFWRLYDTSVPARPANVACPPLLELAGYVDDRLDGAARERLEAHLSDCLECRDAIVHARGALESVASSGDVASPLAVIRRARTLRARGTRGRHVLRRIGRWGVAAAFAALAAVGGLEAGAATSGPQTTVETALQDELSFGLLDETRFEDDPLITWPVELGVESGEEQ